MFNVAEIILKYNLMFYYRATECNATQGIAVAIMSVRLSVCPSDAYIVTKL